MNFLTFDFDTLNLNLPSSSSDVSEIKIDFDPEFIKQFKTTTTSEKTNNPSINYEDFGFVREGKIQLNIPLKNDDTIDYIDTLSLDNFELLFKNPRYRPGLGFDPGYYLTKLQTDKNGITTITGADVPDYYLKMENRGYIIVQKWYKKEIHDCALAIYKQKRKKVNFYVKNFKIGMKKLKELREKKVFLICQKMRYGLVKILIEKLKKAFDKRFEGTCYDSIEEMNKYLKKKKMKYKEPTIDHIKKLRMLISKQKNKKNYVEAKNQFKLENENRLNKKKKMHNNYKKIFEENRSRFPDGEWFGFKYNKDLLNLFVLLNINPKYFSYSYSDNLTIHQKRSILNVILKICCYTRSKQAIFLVRTWQFGNKIKYHKGFTAFKKTFYSFFDMENNFLKYREAFMNSCKLLSLITGCRNILRYNINGFLWNDKIFQYQIK